jgi:hypothetical protein
MILLPTYDFLNKLLYILYMYLYNICLYIV